MERAQRYFNLVILGPLLAAPVLGVEFPRVLAFLPIASAILGALILHFGLKQRLRFPKPVLVFGGVLLMIMAASLLWARDFEVSFERFSKTSILIPLYGLYLSVLISGKQFINKNTPVYLMIACGIGAALMSLDLSLNSIIYRQIRGLSMDDFLNTAEFNRGAVSIVFLALAALSVLPRKITLINLAAILPVLLMLTLVQSQSAQLAAIVGVAFLVLFPASKSWAWYGLFFLIAAFSLLSPFLVGLLYGNIPQWILDLPLIRGGSLWHRMEIWAFIADQVKQHPLVGQGLESTKIIKHNFSVGNDSILHPHSLILQIWLELGLLGIALGIAAIGALMKIIYKRLDPQSARAAITCFIAVFAVANVSYGMWQAWWLGLLCLVAGALILTVQEGQNGGPGRT